MAAATVCRLRSPRAVQTAPVSTARVDHCIVDQIVTPNLTTHQVSASLDDERRRQACIKSEHLARVSPDFPSSAHVHDRRAASGRERMAALTTGRCLCGAPHVLCFGPVPDFGSCAEKATRASAATTRMMRRKMRTTCTHCASAAATWSPLPLSTRPLHRRSNTVPHRLQISL